MIADAAFVPPRSSQRLGRRSVAPRCRALPAAVVACFASLLGAGIAMAQTTSIVSVGTAGVLPEGCPEGVLACASIVPSISSDGRYVVFMSNVLGLTPGLPPEAFQILRHDRETCTTVRVSETPDGQPGNFNSWNPAISADGRVIPFGSEATNLVPGVPPSERQIYVYDASTSSIQLVSASELGVAGNASSAGAIVSDDGRWIVFHSDASNLVPDDTNGERDIFVYDRSTDSLKLVSVSESGEQGDGPSGNPHMSADGRYIVFNSMASNFSEIPHPNTLQVYRLDRDANGTGTFDETGGTALELVSLNDQGEPANQEARFSAVSNDGQLVAFASRASNLVPGVTNDAIDIYLRDVAGETTSRESVGPDGAETTAGSFWPLRFSADGRFLTFHSPAQELVAGGHNGVTHIIRRDLTTGENIVVSRNSAGDFADQSSEVAAPSAAGDPVAFGSAGNNLIPGGSPIPNRVHVYVRSLDGAPDVCGISGPLLSLDPWSHDFGEVEVGSTSPPLLATLSNVGDTDATGLSFSGLPEFGFDADTSACGDLLPAGGTCTVEITFTPAVPGPASAALNVSSAEGSPASIRLAGLGVGEGCEFDPELDHTISINDGDTFTVTGSPIEFPVDVPDTGGTVVGFSFEGTVFIDPFGGIGIPANTQLNITNPELATHTVGGQPPPGTPWDFQSATNGLNVTYRHGIGGDEWDGDGLPDCETADTDSPGTWEFSFVRVGGLSTPQWSDVTITLHSISEDEDGDGVTDRDDVCPGTAIPEPVPTAHLKPLHYALVDKDATFDSVAPAARAREPLSITTADTAGCSCDQIILALELGSGHQRFGCSEETMLFWIDQVGP